MNRQLHTKQNTHINKVIAWLENLMMQEKDGKPVHDIQSFCIVNCYQPHVSTGYLGIVLCNHSQHEIAEEIVQEMAENKGEPPMREQEVSDGQLYSLREV